MNDFQMAAGNVPPCTLGTPACWNSRMLTIGV